MFRLFIPIAFTAVFIIWVLYHFLIKKDLKAHTNTMYVGLFFVGVWGVLYFLMLK